MIRLISQGMIALFAVSIVSACASKTVKVEVAEPTFKVLEAAPGGRESWHDTPQVYAEENNMNVKDNFYYTGEARSADKRMACEKAFANVTDDVAKQVATFVDSSIARASSESTQTDTAMGQANSAVSEETIKTSNQLAKSSISNVALKKQYWELRDYSETGGPKNIYQCWVLVEISRKDVEKLVAKATTYRAEQNPELKKMVGENLSQMQKNYEQFHRTH
jgi:hypothetical protein